MKELPETLSELKLSVCGAMSGLFEENGYSPLVGKIFSLLLSSPEPLSLQEIAAQLDVSKAAASVQVRVLERSALCRKVPLRNDRRDYYAVSDELGVTMIRSELERMRRMHQSVESAWAALQTFRNIEPQEQPSFDALKKRFDEMHELCRLFAARMNELESDWKERHA